MAGMLEKLIIVAALRDLVPWIPVLVIIAVLYSFGIKIRVPGRRGGFYVDDDEG